MNDWFLLQFYIQLVFKATLYYKYFSHFCFKQLFSEDTCATIFKMKSWKKHPQKYLRKTEIDFFFLLPWACSKMWLIDQLYIKLGFLHREYQFSIFIRQIHFFVSKLLILRRWNERFLEFHQFHSGDLYSHLIFSAMIKMKYLSNLAWS